ncbi:MAG: hypothetical protein ACRDKW_00655 [Actinomycetota bacterium]
MRNKAAVTILVLLLLVVAGLPLAGAHEMRSCPECLSASALAGMGLCLAVLGGAIVLGFPRVEWLRGRPQPRPRPLLLALLDRPPRSA